MTGIISYGYYVPRYRIRIAEIARMWGKRASDIEDSLGVVEKTVSGVDEDSLTMAYEASSYALFGQDEARKSIRSVFFGSESPPYAVNPSSTILAEFLGLGTDYLASDMQFACKAGTGALIATAGLIESGFETHGLVVASDKATGRPHDALEYTASSGAVSLLVGAKDVAVEILEKTSYSSDTPDFWRREGIRYPSHGGRFTGKPSYFRHVGGAVRDILQKTKMKPEDFTYAVFHMPNGKFPLVAAASLGFTRKQVEPSLVVPYLGNSYTASGLMGLVSVLEHAKKNDTILFASYGSGAGSDAFVLRATGLLDERRQPFAEHVAQKEYIDYATYLKFMHII